MRSPLLPISLIALVSAMPAHAQQAEPSGTRIMLGGGIDWMPAFPGADGLEAGFFPLIEVWDAGEPMPVETPDEGIGSSIIGDADGASIGPSIRFSPRRRPRDVGLDVSKVGFGVEVGGFAQVWLGEHLRLRSELRQGIGGHDSLTGDVAADLVWRNANDRVLLTAGPRLRWGSGGHARTYFGVTAEEAMATGLAAYRPDGGLYAYGGIASAHLHVTDAIGIYGYAGYERLTGDAARSPLVRAIGDRNQTSVGIGLSYRFTVNR